MTDLLSKLEDLQHEATNYAKIGRTAPWSALSRLETLIQGHRWIAKELSLLRREMLDAEPQE